MIVTELYKGQGLGNQLWCYSACRSIADELNMPFMILGRENFKAAHFLDICFHAKDHILSEEEYNFYIFHEQRFYDKEIEYVASGYDKLVEKLTSNTQIEGFFQSEKYFYNNINRIREYIEIKAEYRDLVNIPDGTCVLNIRGGEYKRHKRFNLPKSYWVAAMKNMRDYYGINRFLIVTDDHKYARALFPDINIVQKGIAESYISLHNASYLIVSNSTFSYFPIKTKLIEPIVIAPKYFARFNDEHNRWASPANIYSEWLWQDRAGNLQTYDDCLVEVQNVEKMYANDYYIKISPSLIAKKGLGIFIPAIVKNVVKELLSKFFPLKYG